MRPYLAVLKDSFREAMASRVLWIALIGIVLLLLVLVPFGRHTDRVTQFRRHDLVDVDRFLQQLESGRDEASSAEAYIWSVLNEQQQSQFEELLKPQPAEEPPPQPGPPRGGFNQKQREVVDIINTLVRETDFSQSDIWQSLKLDEDLQGLLDQGAVDEQTRQHRNLRLLVAAFPRHLRISSSEVAMVTYGGRDLLGSANLTSDDISSFLDRNVVSIVALFLGFFGVFASLLVTAGMIPRTFEPGEISLLLSKPINRGLLFVFKFIGGCIFTLVCAVVLVTGFWLILGLRLHFWKHELLLSIPIYVFLFAIYYAVSAVTGAIWRNSIISIVTVILFWICVWGLGKVKDVTYQLVIEPQRITEVTTAGDSLVAVNSGRDVFIWDEQGNNWRPIMTVQDDQQMPAFTRRFMFSGTRFKPVYDPSHDRILALQHSPSRLAVAGGGKLLSSAAADNWEREVEANAPGTVSDVFITHDGHVILTDRSAIYEFLGQTDQQKMTQQFMGNFLGRVLGTSSRSAFHEVHPDNMPAMAVQYSTAMDPQTGTVVYYSEGTVYRFDRSEEGTYLLGSQRDLELQESALLDISGACITVATAEGRLRVLNVQDLTTLTEDQLPAGELPRAVAAAPDGSTHAVLTHSGSLWLVNAQSGKPIDWRPEQDGSTHTVSYSADGSLIVSDGRQSVYRYQVEAPAPQTSFETETEWLVNAYDYFFLPLYTVLPKPAELDNLALYTMTGETSLNVNEGQPAVSGRRELLEERVSFDVWKPLWSNIAFVVVILGLGCLYVSRRDF